MARGAVMPAPQPLLIDAAGHACVAWWHAPASAADARLAPVLPRGWLPAGALPLAVVLANSWGEEDMSGYDGQRALATALAEGGLGTLRFEWPDTGDSSAATGTTSLADALAAFHAAAAQALALSGCDRLAFAGLRLGALLAAHAAAARGDVGALVGLLPVAGGLAFVQAQRLLGAGRVAHAPQPAPGASFDAADLPVQLGGFALSVRHLEALSALKWPASAAPALQDALLLGPPGAPGCAAADALVQMGARVREWAHEDLSGARAIEHRSGLAPVAIAEIVRWLQERAGDATGARAAPSVATAGLEAATGTVLALSAAGARAWMALSVHGVAVRERVVHVGTPGETSPPSLVGVLAERDLAAPADSARGPRRALVLLSSARERRVGPHRLWVHWARQRAALGDVVLRIDIAGIGDSARHARGGAVGVPEQDDPRAVEDLARVLAWLRREHGVGACTVMGIGSGAYPAWRGALQGLDIQHVVALNPLRFHPTTDPALDPAGLAARARRAVRPRLRDIARLMRWPLKDDLAADLVRISGRGVALDFVFSRDAPGLARLREDAGLRGMRLVRDGRVNVCVVAPADPTFAGTAGRAALYASLDSLLPSGISAAAEPSPLP
jgi:alpha/beta superfamily hydrolase